MSAPIHERRSTKRRFAWSTLTGVRPTTCPSARSTCWRTRSSANRFCPSTSSLVCSATSARRRGSTSCTSISIGRFASATSTRSSSRVRGTAAPAWWRMRTSRARTRSSTQTSDPTRRGCGGCSASSRFRAASRATSRPRCRARFTKVESSAMRWFTLSEPRSTTPTCSWPALSETARQRRGRSRRAGTRTSSSTPRGTEPCSRSST